MPMKESPLSADGATNFAGRIDALQKLSLRPDFIPINCLCSLGLQRFPFEPFFFPKCRIMQCGTLEYDEVQNYMQFHRLNISIWATS